MMLFVCMHNYFFELRPKIIIILEKLINYQIQVYFYFKSNVTDEKQIIHESNNVIKNIFLQNRSQIIL